MTAVWERYPKAKVLIVVPTIALLDQWRAALQDELGIGDSDIGLIGGGAARTGDALVTVAVMNSARNIATDLTAQGEWFLVVDECLPNQVLFTYNWDA